MTKLTEPERMSLEDIKAFIEFGIKNELSYANILGTLIHDAKGLFFEYKPFLPRTSGYAKNVE